MKEFRIFLWFAVFVAMELGHSKNIQAQATYESAEDFAAYASKLRVDALQSIGPKVFVPTAETRHFSRFAWKRDIVTTTFWVGELPTVNNPTPNNKSAWDPQWQLSYGGYDSPEPEYRNGFLPKDFVPRQNPFYCALPYNDVTSGTTKLEAKHVIPWFKKTYKRYGLSVLKGRWIAIRHGKRIAYAQWEDCGPYRTDHWQYVFGKERPTPNNNGGAGLDVSPAVRDYLGMRATDVTDWRFVEESEVPPGPWRKFGDNNPFANKASSESRVPSLAKNDAKASIVQNTP